MTWTTIADVAAAACLLAGAFLAFAAGVGVVRFPDLLSRMHAGTKPQVLGLILLLTGEALRVRNLQVLGMLVLVAVFQLMTAPVAAHMVGRAGYRTGKVRSDLLVVDELTDDQAASSPAATSPASGAPAAGASVAGAPAGTSPTDESPS
ncbi:monovalent cation/H(+) antiporter subunit G [Sanguibacter antarcticus]|uniref:Multisubunit sodium/proton antiporter MrpG subunit n=1 Tax=Sanguibacter antarcticus TaxID=372484 RepID=A0A2A9E9S6_9MICO|nr:monovalent cation/H(+) antiporter subunit G [Sanguibacter antarcticus]PFG35025.1 multisubunit sodium/proton antiporter MrpG subunit [Sanguibacter antarcticus]